MFKLNNFATHLFHHKSNFLGSQTHLFGDNMVMDAFSRFFDWNGKTSSCQNEQPWSTFWRTDKWVPTFPTKILQLVISQMCVSGSDLNYLRTSHWTGLFKLPKVWHQAPGPRWNFSLLINFIDIPKLKIWKKLLVKMIGKWPILIIIK